MKKNTLSKKEIKRLGELGRGISISLDLELTDLNGLGIPCRTDRLAGVEDMKEYLEIHNYKVVEEKIIMKTLQLIFSIINFDLVKTFLGSLYETEDEYRDKYSSKELVISEAVWMAMYPSKDQYREMAIDIAEGDLEDTAEWLENLSYVEKEAK